MKKENEKMATILIVDDEQTIRRLLKDILEAKGYVCIPAANAEEARGCLKKQDFGLVLCDIQMPGESGMEFIQHVLGEKPETAVVMVTGIDDPIVAKEALEIGVYDYITKPIERNRVLTSVANALRRRGLEIQNREYSEHLERLVSERTESLQKTVRSLEKTQVALQESEAKFRSLFETSKDVICITTKQGHFIQMNKAGIDLFGYSEEELSSKNFDDLYVDSADRSEFLDLIEKHNSIRDFTVDLKKKDGAIIKAFITASARRDDDAKIIGYQGIIRDITEQKILESQLVQAQKLESIGQLAAGIAHEINTPMQYVAYNTRFLQEQFENLDPLLDKYRELFQAAKAGSVLDDFLAQIESAVKDVDLDFIREEIPPAIDQTLEGAERVAEIVRAMKEFSHPGTEEKTSIDINKAIESTVTVARNEWKYVAEVVTDLDANLPLVPCLPGDFNQVILNMLVNAAHAIGDVIGDGSDTKGTINIRTSRNDGLAEIRIQDTGTGIPEEHRSRIFDPFYTTKEVGKGTGQGLAISHSVIVDKHGGSLNFETEKGKGTTFIIRLPIQGASG